MTQVELEQRVNSLENVINRLHSSVMSLFMITDAIYSVLTDKEVFSEEEFATTILELQQQAEEAMHTALKEQQPNSDEEDSILSGISIS